MSTNVMKKREYQEYMLREEKRALYHRILCTLDPTDSEIQIGYALVKDPQIQAILAEGLAKT